MLITSLILLAYNPPASQQALADASKSSTQTKQSVDTSVSVDQLVATDLASSLAETTDMPVRNNVANLSQSLAVESILAQTNVNVISKPQIVQPTADGRSVKQYTAVAGDTVEMLATKFGISPETIKWTNNLTSDAIAPGKVLTILPVDGVLYTAKDGDTVAGLSSRYGADSSSIVAYNDLELAGEPTPGSQLILPGANLPSNERPGYVAPRPAYNGLYGTYGGGYGVANLARASVGNRYAWGNCTWYVYERRLELGLPIGSFWGNANTWAYNAQLAGLGVDGNPLPGSIMQNGGGYGHVAVVESINPGVSITISEMNGYRFGGGYNRIGHGTIPWSEATSGYYRYIH